MQELWGSARSNLQCDSEVGLQRRARLIFLRGSFVSWLQDAVIGVGAQMFKILKSGVVFF